MLLGNPVDPRSVGPCEGPLTLAVVVKRRAESDPEFPGQVPPCHAVHVWVFPVLAPNLPVDPPLLLIHRFFDLVNLSPPLPQVSTQVTVRPRSSRATRSMRARVVERSIHRMSFVPITMTTTSGNWPRARARSVWPGAQSNRLPPKHRMVVASRTCVGHGLCRPCTPSPKVRR